MLRTIFVPLDGSPIAEQALAYAERLAQATSARMILSRVIPLTILDQPDQDLPLASDARTYLEDTARRVRAGGCSVITIEQWGDPSESILDQIRSNNVDLVVMGTHVRSVPSRWLHGSVADRVLRGSPVRVLLIPPTVTTRWPSWEAKRILVPLDGSQLAEAALAPAEDLATSLGSEILLVEVACEPEVELADCEQYLAEVAARVRATGATVRTHVELAQPELAIAAVARREQVDLIIMATHGRGGIARLMLGSVASGSIQRTSVPIMLLGPEAVHAAAAAVPAPIAAAT